MSYFVFTGDMLVKAQAALMSGDGDLRDAGETVLSWLAKHLRAMSVPLDDRVLPAWNKIKNI